MINRHVHRAGLPLLSAAFVLALAAPAAADDDDDVLPLSVADDAREKIAEEVVEESEIDPLPTTMAQGRMQGGGSRSGPGGPRPFLDFRNSEINPFVGAVMFSGEFESDPSFSAGILFRVPAPALPWRRFGFFFEGLFSSVDRDIPFYYPNRDGNVLVFGGGLDFEFLSSESVSLKAQAGGIYGLFDDIDGIDDGFGGLFGAALGFTWVQMRQRIMIGYNPQLAFDGSDFMFFHHVGVTISF